MLFSKNCCFHDGGGIGDHYEPNLKEVGTVCWVNAKPPRFSINFDSLAALR